jgi:SulP family sulfate permease
LVGGFPASGSISRTTANVNNGAKTSIASYLHGVIILIYMLSLAPFLSYIPMASLAAILVNVAYHVSHYRQFSHIVKFGPKSDSIVLLVCFALTVLINMVAGVTAGVVLACFLLS